MKSRTASLMALVVLASTATPAEMTHPSVLLAPQRIAEAIRPAVVLDIDRRSASVGVADVRALHSKVPLASARPWTAGQIALLINAQSAAIDAEAPWETIWPLAASLFALAMFGILRR